ncbi:peptide/nickel transport system permease protein [Streptomyces sp. LBL]|uniref:ABC transporter permease n=1 Tax=Streptomyces sp. LBL TaxID=2940562 RepID=UPI002475EA35|nr:ABC transporter permease [Streptomyces sp. LBL]MDH6626218.1 peptide/nickel transport system permease protein [Streptomyces sp. LBL]
MIRYLTRKVPSVMFVLLASSIVAFALPRLAPGDVSVTLAGSDPTAANIAAIRRELGLDRPLTVQYWEWISGLFHGDLGQSYLLHRSVSSLIGDRLESTVELAVFATLLVLVIGTTLGVLAGSAKRWWARTGFDLGNSILVAVPSFLMALAFILVFGVYHRWLPVSGEVSVLHDPSIGIQYLVLPAVALALSPAGSVARLLQTEMSRVRNEDFVDLALAKGASPRRITLRHVLRNSFGTAVVAIGLEIGTLLGGAVVMESVFNRNGLGQLAVSSVQTRDFTVLQVLILGVVCVAVICQIVTEMVLAALDPKIRLGDQS